LTFTSEFWHPNIHEDGKVCISILHPPGEDEMSGERPEERWLPTQTPETILLSVISLLSDPNIYSPANVDAGVEWRDKKDAFRRRVKKLIEKANAILPADFEMPKPKKHIVPSTPIDNGEYDFEIEVCVTFLNC
jgi:ubiquitin-conjugating enzyme E2 R